MLANFLHLKVGCEAAAHGIFRYAAGIGKKPQVAGAPGLGTEPAHAEAAKWLPVDNGSGAASIDVQVADLESDTGTFHV